MTAPQAIPALGATVQTTEEIGTMPKGRKGVVIRRNKRSITIQGELGGIATVPHGLFVTLTTE